MTFYYVGGSVGTALPAWFWVNGGWPACVGLFVATSLVTLAFGLGVVENPLPRGTDSGEIMDTAI